MRRDNFSVSWSRVLWLWFQGNGFVFVGREVPELAMDQVLGQWDCGRYFGGFGGWRGKGMGIERKASG